MGALLRLIIAQGALNCTARPPAPVALSVSAPAAPRCCGSVHRNLAVISPRHMSSRPAWQSRQTRSVSRWTAWVARSTIGAARRASRS